MSDPSGPEVETVADRLARLEKSLAALQNTDGMEQVLAQRVLERLSQAPPGFAGAAGPDGLATGPEAAGGVLVPAALRAMLPAVAGAAAGGAAGVWARVPFLAELRLMVRLYFDPRYRLSRLAQFGVPLVLGLVAVNYVFFNHLFGIPFVPLVSIILERLVLVVLAVVLYKILAREAARYGTVLSYLGRYGG